jgi:hypothetical protein
MANEPVGTSNPPPPGTATLSVKTQGDPLTPDKMKEMLDVLEGLLNHTHIFFDDYGTACNCNCNCNCTRGST